MPSAVEVRGLSKRFGPVQALERLDVSIERGELFALLGPNGAGKSTLINILAGLTRADAGTAEVYGRDVVRCYRETRRRLGVVPQEIVFDPFFRVCEMLRIQAGYFGLRRRQVEPWIDELLTGLGLVEKAEAEVRTLSGGMKRRLLIAQALVHRPDVLVLDEPTAGVDVKMRKDLWAFVRRLRDEGCTVILTTHYLEEAEVLCDRFAILHHGRLVALDTRAALLGKSRQASLEQLFLELTGDDA